MSRARRSRAWDLRRRLLAIPFVRQSVLEPIDTSIFRERPRGKVAWGLFIVSVASLMGAPLGSVLLLVGARLGAPLLASVVAPALYVSSIPLFAFGLYLSGPAAMAFANVTLRLGVRAVARRVLGGRLPLP